MEVARIAPASIGGGAQSIESRKRFNSCRWGATYDDSSACWCRILWYLHGICNWFNTCYNLQSRLKAQNRGGTESDVIWSCLNLNARESH